MRAESTLTTAGAGTGSSVGSPVDVEHDARRGTDAHLLQDGVGRVLVQGDGTAAGAGHLHRCHGRADWLPAEDCGHRVGQRLRSPKGGHTAPTQQTQRVGGRRYDEHPERRVGGGGVDDRLDADLGAEAGRASRHHDHRVELGRVQQHVERPLDGVVGRPRERQVDERTVPGLDPEPSEPCGRHRRGGRDLQAGRGQAVDRHRAAAAGGRHHGHSTPGRRRDRYPPRQQLRLEERVEGGDPGDAVRAQEGIRHGIVAGQRPRVRHRQACAVVGAAELVGHDRLALRGRGSGEVGQLVGVGEVLEEQGESGHRDVVEGGVADLTERDVELVAHRHHAGEADAHLHPA